MGAGAILKIINAFSPWSYIVLVVLALLAYNRWIDDPMVRREARAGYVTEATLAAKEAERVELLRQWAAAESTAALWHSKFTQSKKEQAAQDVQDAIDTKNYQADIDAAKLECRKLDQHDLDYLNGVQHNKPK